MADYSLDIYNQVVAMGYSPTLANLIVAQAKHESANFSSSVFNRTNNAFGYKCVEGNTIQSGCDTNPAEGGGHYAMYRTVADSAKEVVLWLGRRQSEGKIRIADIQDPESYAEALKKGGYYGASITEYSSGISRWLQQVGSYMAPASSATAQATVGAGVTVAVIAVIALTSWWASKAFIK